MLDADELREIRTTYERLRPDYQEAAKYMQDRCSRFRRDHPKLVRMVFSREPQVKTLESIIQKIETRRRSGDPSFAYDSVHDIVAITALCPYSSDVKRFIEWMKKAFSPITSDKDAHKLYDSGHRGYHYIVTLTDEELQLYPSLSDIRCEIQVKTLLQEAFDAKSHDLAYKPGHLEVGKELKTQFSLLSASLHAIDQQTEFLKSLILRDQRELEFRRKACLQLYLEGHQDVPAKLGLDPQALPDVVKISETLKKKAGELLSVAFCKFAAYCALKQDHDLLRSRAIEYANQFVKQNPTELYRKFVRGTILWALGEFEKAFSDLAEVANGVSPEADPTLHRKAINNFIYSVCDCTLFKFEVQPHWKDEAENFFKELRSIVDADDAEKSRAQDTIGFYLIMFGETSDEIDEGRALLRKAKASRNDKSYAKYYHLHEYVALDRLMRLSKQNLNW